MASPPQGVELVPVTWLRPHEEVIEARVDELSRRFSASRMVDYAVVADRHTGTVIDGHHRLETLRRLGAERVPVVLVDYLDSDIAVRNWRENEPDPTKEDVVAHATSGRLYPPKTTRHDFVRALDAVNVPLHTLGVKPQRTAQ